MKPIDILQTVGNSKIENILEELNSGQFKRVLLSGNIPTRIPTSVISLKKRVKIWKERVFKAVDDKNVYIASTLIYEWLLHRRRSMLVKYLDLINVKHKKGETDETFLKTVPPETLKSKAAELFDEFSPQDVSIYVHFSDYHQKTEVFENDDNFVLNTQDPK
jgi:hypothetical protein